MNDSISRQAAIDAIEGITASMSICVTTDECHGMKRMQRQAINELANLPSAQPDLQPTCNQLATDCISRQAAFDALNGEIEITGRTNVKVIKGYVGLVGDRLARLPSVQPERWIPCSERLPEAQTEVIVSCTDDSGDTKFRYTSSGWVTTGKEYWIVDNEINNFVVAWKEMPEPYKGEQE